MVHDSKVAESIIFIYFSIIRLPACCALVRLFGSLPVGPVTLPFVQESLSTSPTRIKSPALANGGFLSPPPTAQEEGSVRQITPKPNSGRSWVMPRFSIGGYPISSSCALRVPSFVVGFLFPLGEVVLNSRLESRLAFG